MERIDLIQLHCPPSEVYYRPEIFELFDRLVDEGKIAHLGVSVEKVEEALKGIEYPNVKTVQIIFNIFRQRPTELFFREAAQKNIGILARVPLASGLLTGKFSKASSFAKDDHRNFNREGAAFDKGETFSGVEFELGLETVEKLKAMFPGKPLSQLALKWILMYDEVSCVIPGASNVAQVESNLEALQFNELSREEMNSIKELYDQNIREPVHHLW